ncbi:MAG: polysaccharide deacetylase family protein [Patescibacteria group bacterium]
MDLHAQKLKIVLGTLGLVLIVGITYGMFSLSTNRFFSFQNFSHILSYFQLKTEYSMMENNQNLLATTISAFSQSEKVQNRSTGVAKTVPVLLYHGIVEKADRFSMTKETFKDQIFSLKKAGYQTISVSDLIDFENGNKELPEKSFLLTFDDGRMDSYLMADPILKVVGYTAVMYVAVADSFAASTDIGIHSYYISLEDIQSMIKSGRWEIGSHAIQESQDGVKNGFVQVGENGEIANFLSNKKWITNENRLETDEEYTSRILHELHDSKKELEEKLGVTIESMSYPFGDYGQQSINNPDAINMINAIVKDNYRIAFQQVWPEDGDFSFNRPGINPAYLKRIEIPTAWSGEQLVTFMTQNTEKTLPVYDSFTSQMGWRDTWSHSSIEENSLVLASSATTTGAMVFLDGTQTFSNYIYAVTADWKRGSHVSLVVRYIDPKNYTSCTFADNAVRLEQYTNGLVRKLSESKNLLELSTSTPVSLAVSINDDFAKCIIGNNIVTFATVSSGMGGVGLKVWDQELGNARVDFKTIQILPTDEIQSYLAFAPKYDLKQTSSVNKPVSKSQAPDSTSPTIPNPNPIFTENIFSPHIVSSIESTTTPIIPEPEIPIPVPELFIAPIMLFNLDGESTPYHMDITDPYNGWKNIFGSLLGSEGEIIFGTNASTTSSLAVLQGSEMWTNYLYSTNLNWHSGTGMTLVARYVDEKNYTACSFSTDGKSVRLYQVINGDIKTIGQSPQLPLQGYATWENIHLGMSVKGTHVECLKDGIWAMRADLPNMASTGGIGVKTYDVTRGAASIGIKEITVFGIEN